MQRQGAVQFDIDLLDRVLSGRMGLHRVTDTYNGPGFPAYELRGIRAADAGDRIVAILKFHEEKYGPPIGYSILKPNLLLLISKVNLRGVTR